LAILLPALTGLILASCVTTRVMRAENAYSKGDVDAAEPLVEAALESDPSDLRARKLGSKIATRRGVDALSRGDLVLARKYFERAKTLDQGDDVAPKYLDQLDREEAERRSRF
jgi:Tfp pilus assembly protein PilF